MNHLLRELAPVSDAGWSELDEEARSRLVPALAARKIVDFSGPHGWSYSATNLGRVTSIGAAPCDGVSGTQRRVLPVTELRADFEIALAELQDIDRGTPTADLEPLDTAARQIAVAENRAVFHGWSEASIAGIAEVSPHPTVTLGDTVEGYPKPVAAAVHRLLRNGISGPYALALGGEQWERVVETAEHGGYPLLEHLGKILEGGPIVWAPGVRGAVVLSIRGGDFRFESGQDLAIGYVSHDAEVVRLYLQESFSFHVATPEAAVALEPSAS